jgi:hypothetical protein
MAGEIRGYSEYSPANQENINQNDRTISTGNLSLCGLVVRVPGYRSRGPGSIPGATRFSEK